MLLTPARTTRALLQIRLSPTIIRLLLYFLVFHLLIRELTSLGGLQVNRTLVIPLCSDAPGVAPGQSRPKDDSSSLVFSGVLSVDLRDNQLDEIASQSILADRRAVHRDPAVS